MIPRGVRNNNPGNLVISRIPWEGKVPKEDNTDGKFEQFIDMEHGIRAMLMDIRTDIVKKKLNTIKKLILSYAPPSENDTKAYIEAVSKATGIPRDHTLTATREVLCKLAAAISRHENGGNWITNEQINKAWEML